MNFQIFQKSKRFYLILAAVIMVGGFYIQRSRQRNAGPNYETARIERGTVTQTVEATGKIESVSDLSLRFETAGTIDRINVRVGQQVTTGTILATLRLAELQAAVSAAAANLNQKLAGATEQDRAYYAAAVQSAKAALEQARIDGETAVKAAEAAYLTAKNNLQLAGSGDDSRIVDSAYQDAVAIVQTSISKADDALTQADNILSVDNVFANESFRTALAVLDSNTYTAAVQLYIQARAQIALLHEAGQPLAPSSNHTKVDAGLESAEQSLMLVNQLLTAVSAVLRATVPTTILPQAALDAKKTTIEAARAAVTAQYTAVINQKQAIADAKNSLSSYQIAFDKANQDWTKAKANAENSARIKEAAYNQAAANLETRVLPPREVDVAYNRAVLAQAVANRNKAILRAPQSGLITDVTKKAGEFASSADVAIKLLSPHYEIAVDIPETDVPKIALGQTANITLDAFGSDQKFYGRVVKIDPAATEIQDVVYYTITAALAETEPGIKPGMTANLSVATGEKKDVLFVPWRAVRTRGDGTKYVRKLHGGAQQEAEVALGLKGDDGRVEILSGLNEGDTVIVGVKAGKK